ncbi:MAG: hypothetical protein MHM6MM_002607 [Cercozoa sp. M6MM]
MNMLLLSLVLSMVLAQALPVFYDGRTGERISRSDVESRLSSPRVRAVLSGEYHGHTIGLKTQFELFEAFVEQHDQAALAMEFFERDMQLATDEYFSGLISTDTFLEKTGKRRNSPSYPRGHEKLVELCRHEGLPMVAANSPRRYNKVAREQGYEALSQLTSPWQRAMFAVPDKMPSGEYEKRFFELFSDNDEVEQLWRSQCLWDSSMAQAVSQSIRRDKRDTFLVVGAFHVQHEGGTVQLLRHYSGLQEHEIVTMTMLLENEPVNRLPAHLLDEADIVYFVGDQFD